MAFTPPRVAHAQAAPEPEPAAEAEPAFPIIPGTSMFTRFELREGYEDVGASRGRFLEGDAIFYRARLGLQLTPLDIGGGTLASVQFTPQASGKLGTLGSTVADAALGLHEGYLRLAGSGARFDLGRFELDYGDALVIGNLGWHQTARSFDGFRMRAIPVDGSAFVDVFFTIPRESHPAVDAPFGAGDNYFIGIYSDVGPWVSEGMALDLYLLANTFMPADGAPVSDDPADGTQDVDGAVEVTVGARAKQKIGSFDYRGEAGLQLGERIVGVTTQSVTAYHGDLELGLSFDAVRVALEGLYASGEDGSTSDLEGWNQLFPTAHKFLGLMDVFGARTNAISGVAHLSYEAADDFAAKLDAHLFSRPETTPAGVEGYVGSELDFIALYSLGAGAGVRGLYGIYMPSDELGSTDPVHYLEIELAYER
jgi:hypothetical protein